MTLPKSPAAVLAAAAAAVLIALSLALVSGNLWGGKPEKVELPERLVLSREMPLAEVASANGLSKEVLQKAFSLQPGEARGKTLGDLGLGLAEAESRLRKASALGQEHASKNWVKIFAKFALWFAFLPLPFYLLRRRRMTPGARKALLASGILLFGIALGSEPNPMGTVKDMIALLGISGVIFPPRAVALTVFLLLVVLANKFICSWGCQLGVLQDLLHRLNRGRRDRRGVLPQWKPPFWLSNGVRVATFVALTAAAFLWAFDLIEPIDPFRFFKPAHLGIAGGLSVALVLGASLFVYRPWCHFFCPFGLVSWLGEKVSLFKIQVDYDNCPKCDACVQACPSTAMLATLYRDRTLPDCFSCGTCVDVCPTGALSFGAGRRALPGSSWLAMPKGGWRVEKPAAAPNVVPLFPEGETQAAETRVRKSS